MCVYYIKKIVEVQQQIYSTRGTLTLPEKDIHVNTGKTYHYTGQKKKIIVGLLQVIQTMLEVHGVIPQIAGIGVTYRCVEVSKTNI